jgi:hypothetical protein
MKKSFFAMLNILPSFSMKLVAPAPDNHKASNGSDAQADALDQYAANKELASSEVEDDFGELKWAYRGHYRSIFPPMI